MESIRLFLLFLKKDFTLEMRGKEFLLTSLSLSLFCAILLSLSLTNAFIDSQTTLRIFPTFFWLGTFFVGLLSVGRAYGYETTYTVRTSFQTDKKYLLPFIASKILVTAVIVFLSSEMFALTIGILLNLPRYNIFSLTTILVPFAIAFAALGILLTAVTATVQNAVTLFSILMLPLLFPLFFAVTELTSLGNSLEKSNYLDMYSSPWWTLLILIDIVYLMASASLYPFAIRE